MERVVIQIALQVGVFTHRIINAAKMITIGTTLITTTNSLIVNSDRSISD